MDYDKYIRVIENFPKEGISFKDVTTLLKNGEAFKSAVKDMSKKIEDKNIDLIIGPEARGFIFGAPVAFDLGVGFVPVRKPGKLPGDTVAFEYNLEYGTDCLEIHKDAIVPGMRVAIVDDLLATGGTIESTIKLVESLGAEVVHVGFLIELTFLDGRSKLSGYEVEALIKY